MHLITFPPLLQFNSLYARETWEGLETRRVLHFQGKIKLHGANAAISVSPERMVHAQSRKTILSADEKLAGFYDWFEPELWAGIAGEEQITFFGEWAGPGVAKGADAVALTDKKRYYVFAVGIGAVPHSDGSETIVPRVMITAPSSIRKLLPVNVDRDRVVVLPYAPELGEVSFDFNDSDQIKASLALINDAVDRVAVADPFIAARFEVEHPGEGYVMIPHAALENPLSYEDYSRLTFKAKTEKHRVRKQAKPATEREPLPETVDVFLETFVTPQRVDQAIDEISNGTPDIKTTGAIIAWVAGDLKKEAPDEIEALGVEPKRLHSAIANATRAHFMARIEQIDFV